MKTSFYYPFKVLKLLLLSLILLLPLAEKGLLAQSGGNATVPTQSQVPSLNIIPPSPEAAALGKFGDIPVGLYTGVPNISIPLYEIALKDMKLPISLSYHAAGIKADEIASNVGLGWTLTSGGAVTSSVNGIPDDFPNRGWSHVPPGTELEQEELLPNTWPEGVNGWVNDVNYEYMKDFADGDVDSQPDLYYVNMHGRSFKLFFDQAGKAYTMPYQRVKIERIAGSGFIVTDEHDNIYKFQELEMSSTQSVNWGYGDNAASGSVPVYPHNTYYLSRIETPYGEIVSYEYESYFYSFKNQPSQTRYAPYAYEFYTQPTPNEKRTESTTHVTGKRISRITTNRGHIITFTYSYPRKDLKSTGTAPDQASAQALTKVVVTHSPKTPITAYTLTYDHFSAGVNQTDPDNYRLKLLSVSRDGMPGHLFTYNGTPTARLSKGQDHWGYMNGAENSTLLPADPDLGFTTGANREPDAAAAQLGILTKITYPTGGYTLFEYEPNKAFVTEYVKKYGYANAFNTPNSTVTRAFTVGEGGTLFRASYNSPNGTVANTEAGTTSYCTVILHRADGEVVHVFSGQGTNVLQMTALTAGQYYIEIITQGDYYGAYLDLAWEEPGTYQHVNRTVGGLRIKSISSYPVDGVAKIQKFEYNRLEDATQSSGISKFMPHYTYRHNVDYVYGEGLAAAIMLQYPFHAQSTTSLAPLGTVQGGAVAYSAVTVYTQEKEKGYTTHQFSSHPSHDGMWHYPFGPVINNDWVDGLPLKTVDYVWREAEEIYHPVRRVVNTYKTIYGENDPDQVNAARVRGAKILLEVPPVEWSSPDEPGVQQFQSRPPSFGIAYYWLHSSWSYPTGTTEILFDPADSTKQVVTDYRYFYDNPHHIAKTRETVSKSTGEHYAIEYRYPLDYNPARTYKANPVVERRVYNSSTDKLLSAELTVHEERAGVYPSTYYSLTNSQPLHRGQVPPYDGVAVPAGFDEKLKLDYGPDNNVWAVIPSTGPSKQYIWGYKGTYPIAEIVHSSKDESAYTGFETLREGGWEFPQTQPVREPMALNGSPYTLHIAEAQDVSITFNLQLNNTTTHNPNEKALIRIMQGREEIEGFLVSSLSEQLGPVHLAPGTYELKFDYLGNHYSSASTLEVAYAYTAMELSSAAKEGKVAGHCELIKNNLASNKRYTVSLWAKGGNVSVNDISQPASATDWTYLEWEVSNVTQVRVSPQQAVMLDEVRLHPVGALMTTYTYDPLVGMRSSTDPNGKSTYYDYDEFGRLQAIKDHEKNILKTYQYHYKGQ